MEKISKAEINFLQEEESFLQKEKVWAEQQVREDLTRFSRIETSHAEEYLAFVTDKLIQNRANIKRALIGTRSGEIELVGN